MSTLRLEARKLGTNAAVYLLPNLLVRGLSFLLTPLYTRYMTPADYGVLAFCSIWSLFVSMIMGLALHESISRIYFEYKEEKVRRQFYGTLFLFILVAATSIALALQILGVKGTLDQFRIVHFRPHLQIVLWSALFSIFIPITTALYQAHEKPAKVAALNVAAATSQIFATLFFVVFLHQGAVGALRAQLFSNASVGIVSAYLFSLNCQWAFSKDKLKYALNFSLPLIPHQLSSAALSISDRLVLEPHVSTAQLGVYSIGYIFAFVSNMVMNAITSAFSPMLMRKLKTDPQDREVPRIGTYAIVAMALTCLGVAMFSGDAIRLLLPASYLEAATIAPWVVLGTGFQGVYMIWTQGTIFSMKTRGIPVVTALAAAANIALNLMLVPRFGIIAAAWSTAIAYFLLALMHGGLAQLRFPIAWQYRNWLATVTSALGCYFVSRLAATVLPIGYAVLVKVVIILAIFPLCLLVSRVFRFSDLVQTGVFRAGE